MPRALSEETKQQVINLWMNHNYSQQQVADYLGISYKTVNRIVNEYTADGSHEPPKGMPMPERVVPAEPIVQADEPVVMTEEHTAAVPEAVIKAVQDKIDSLTMQIKCNSERIESLQAQNAQMTELVKSLQKWMKEVDG